MPAATLAVQHREPSSLPEAWVTPAPGSPRPAALNGDLVAVPCVRVVGGRPCRMPCAVHAGHAHPPSRGRGWLSPAPPPPWWHSAPAETFVPTSQWGARLSHARHLIPGSAPLRLPWPCLALATAPLPAPRQWLAPRVAVAELGAAVRPSIHPSVCPQEVIRQQEEVSCHLGVLERCWTLWGWGSLGMLSHGAAATHTQPTCCGPGSHPCALPWGASSRGGPAVMPWRCCESAGALSQGRVAPLVPGLQGTSGGGSAARRWGPLGLCPPPALSCAGGSAPRPGMAWPA